MRPIDPIHLHLPILSGLNRAEPMDALPEHTIVFNGLKDGQHEFHFVLDDAFFRATGTEDLMGGTVRAEVLLDKNEHLLVTNISVNGTVDMLCDRCASPMHQQVQGEQRQIFKLTGEDEYEDDVELVGLDEYATEVNLSHYFFECISLNLPARHVHPAGECDPEVEAAMAKVEVSPEAGTDPRWEALKNLRNN